MTSGLYYFLFRSDTVHLECQVRACLNRSCQPKCASDRRLDSELNDYDEYLLTEAIREYEDTLKAETELEEIIYEEEPEQFEDLAAELADMSNVRAAMLKSANRFKTIEDTNPHNEHQITRYFIRFLIDLILQITFSIQFRIKHEPVEEPTGPFEGRLDPISLLLVTGQNIKSILLAI